LEDARDALQVMADEAARACLTFHAEGFVTLDRAHWQRMPRDIQRRLLMRALEAVSPEDYPARFEALEAARQELLDPAFSGRTLSGCELSVMKSNIAFMREASAMQGRTQLHNGKTWDRRFIMSGFPGAFSESVEVGALAAEGLSSLRKNSRTSPGLEELPFKVKCSLPALWHGDNLLAVPHLSYYSAACPLDLNKGKIRFAASLLSDAA
jgi:tRNA(Ile)-lysidine synthase